MSKILLIDSDFLCYRAFYSTGNLSYGNKKTGVIFGFLQSIIELNQFYSKYTFVFCWDHKENKRKTQCPTYKINRHQDPEKEKKLKSMRKQSKKLRKTILKRLGYKNIFKQKGYEGDDIIASVCLHRKANDKITIITADHDLYQLLSPNVSVYNPVKRKRMTDMLFKKIYGIPVKKWSWIKAISGCSSDNISGIKGVGEKSAIKYLRKELKKDSKMYKLISNNKKSILKQNMPLVHLPFEGTKKFKIKENKILEEGWIGVCEDLGMKSIGKQFFNMMTIKENPKHGKRKRKLI